MPAARQKRSAQVFNPQPKTKSYDQSVKFGNRLADIVTIMEKPGKAWKPTLLAALDALGAPPTPHVSSHSLDKAGVALFCGLVGKGDLSTLSSLLDAGWGAAMFRDYSSAEQLYPLLADGKAESYEFMEKAFSHGAFAFRFYGRTMEVHSSLDKAIAAEDQKATLFLLSRIDHEDHSPEQRHAIRAKFATECMSSEHQSMIHLCEDLIMKTPALWARAADSHRGRCALKACCEAGKFELAEAILKADAPAALAHLSLSSACFTVHPLETAKLLLKYGAKVEPGTGQRHGGSLHSVAHANPQEGAVLARLLIEHGADPRDLNHEGATAIGNTMRTWSLSMIRDVFGATDDDLMVSMSMSSTQGVGLRPCVINAMEGWRTDADFCSYDMRMACILNAAFGATAARHSEFALMAIRTSVCEGMPRCLEVAFKHAGQLLVPLDASLMLGMFHHPMGDACEAGRLACLELAARAGIDLSEPVGFTRFGHTEMTTLLGRVFNELMEDESRDPKWFAHMARKGRLLSQLGTALVVAPAARSQPWEDKGWRQFPRALREEVDTWKAFGEAIELRKSISIPIHDPLVKKSVKSL